MPLVQDIKTAIGKYNPVTHCPPMVEARLEHSGIYDLVADIFWQGHGVGIVL
jgi:hypothetical protein